MNTTLSKQIKICKVVRKTTEKIQKEYKEYFYDKKLMGLCGIASYGIYRGFQRNYIPVDFVYGKFIDDNIITEGHHCWVKSKGLIFDVTATQFFLKDKIVITNEDDDRYYEIYSGEFEEMNWGAWQQMQNPMNNPLTSKITKELLEHKI